MKRKGGVILLGIFVELLLMFASFSYLYYQTGNTFHNLNKESVTETFGVFFETSSVGQKIFVSLQAILLVIVLVAIILVYKKTEEIDTPIKKDYIIKKDDKRSRTDLDVLYEILQIKKEVDIDFIKEVFNINPEVALNWAKILEGGNLAEINYPRFSTPILRIIDNTPRQRDKTYLKKENPTEKQIPDKYNNLKNAFIKRIFIENIKNKIKNLYRKLLEIKNFRRNH